MKKKALVASLVCAALLAGCSEESSNISLVQDGVLPAYTESITVGNMLEGYRYASNPQWTYFEGGRGEKVVQFTADISRSESFSAELAKLDEAEYPYNFFTSSKLTVQFLVNVDGKGFTKQYSGLELCWKDNKCTQIQEPPVEDFMKKIRDQEPFAILDLNIVGQVFLMSQYELREGPEGTAL